MTATGSRAPAILWRLRIRPTSAVPDVPTAPYGSRFPPCPPAVPAQSSGPYGLKTPQHRQPLSPDAHAVCAMRGNNGKDRKANLAGGSLLTKMRKAYALFTFCKSP